MPCVRHLPAAAPPAGRAQSPAPDLPSHRSRLWSCLLLGPCLWCSTAHRQRRRNDNSVRQPPSPARLRPIDRRSPGNPHRAVPTVVHSTTLRRPQPNGRLTDEPPPTVGLAPGPDSALQISTCTVPPTSSPHGPMADARPVCWV